MFLARVLEETQMGLYFIALMVVFLLKILSDIGVDLAFVKQYPGETETGQSNLLRSAFTIRAASCTFISILYVMLENSGRVSFINDISHVTVLVLAMYWLHSFRELLLRLLQAEKIFQVFAAVQVLAAVVKAGLVLVLFLIEEVTEVTVKMVLVVEVCAFAISISYAALRIKDKLVSASKAKFKGGFELLKFGYPLYANALLNLGNEKVSQYIVAGFGGPLTMAFYGIAERLSDAGTRLFESFANVYYPSQTGNFANNERQLAIRTAERSLMWVSFVISSVIVGFTILREPVMTIFFTAKYLSAANAAAMFFGVLLLRSTQTLMGYFGVAAGMKFLPVRVSTVSSVFNILLCFTMFKLFGYQGAIAALLLTQLLMNILYYMWLRRAGLTLEISPVITICSACIISVALTFWSGSLLLSLFIFPFFVAICLWALPDLRQDLFEFTRKAMKLIKNKIDGADTGTA